MSTRRALAFSYLDRYVSLVVALVTSMIIARLLTPAQIGTYSITMVMIGFMGPFRELGASQYLIQEKALTTESIRAIWAIQLFMGFALAMLMFFARNVVASFYHNPEISNILGVLALNSLLTPFGALTTSWLMKELKFDQLAIIRFSGTLAGSIGSIYFAWKGLGPISLAYGAFLSAVASALVSFFFRPAHFPWLPGIRGISKVISFGFTMSGITLLYQAYDGAPELILGRLQGMNATGLFGRAQGLVNLFERLVMDSVHAVLLPAFSKLNSEGQSLDAAFVRGVAMITVVGWPMLSFIAIMAHPAINLLYGSQWNNAVGMTQILCIAMSFTLTVVMCPSLLIAIGKRNRVFWVTAITVSLQAIFAYIGASFGFNEIGWGIMLASTSLSVIWLYVTHSIVQFSWSALMATVQKSLIVTAGSMILPIATAMFYSHEPNSTLAPLIIGGIGTVIGFAIAAKISNHPIWLDIYNILIIIKKKAIHAQ